MGNKGQFQEKVKRGYVAPEVTVVVFAAERGFDISTFTDNQNNLFLDFMFWENYNNHSAGDSREYGGDVWSN